jgi:hypothetical protein
LQIRQHNLAARLSFSSMPSKVPVYHPQGVELVEFRCLWAKESLGMSPTKKPARIWGIFYFFIFFEGIRKLQTSKVRTSTVCTQVTRGWKHKCCFLDEVDGGWDLSLQAREKG